MRRKSMMAIVLTVTFLTFSLPMSPADSEVVGSGGGPVRVGVFRREPLLVAYYGSTAHETALGRLRTERQKALDEGDAARAKKLEAEGAALQEMAHRQLAGEAPLTNVLDALKPHLAEVSTAAGVSVVVESTVWHDDDVILVDMTDRLEALLPRAKK